MAKLIGTDPNQVPTNGDLGTMAYQDYDVVAPELKGGRRNLIINGGFEISQRGDYSSNTSTGQNAYRIDRWKHLANGVTANTRRDINQTVNGELMNVWRIEATSTASGRFGIRQYVEATSGGRTPTAGKPTTLSVWMRSNNPNARIYVYDYGTPGILNSHDSHSGNGQWEKLSITFIPSTGSVTANSYGLELNFVCTTPSNGNVSVTSGDYIEIAQPQLELGSVATPFEHRSYGEELALCQRYYQYYDTMRGTTYPSGVSHVYLSWALPVEMRADPTVSVANASPVNTSYPVGADADRTAFKRWYVTGYIAGDRWTSDLILDAEL